MVWYIHRVFFPNTGVLLTWRLELELGIFIPGRAEPGRDEVNVACIVLVLRRPLLGGFLGLEAEFRAVVAGDQVQGVIRKMSSNHLRDLVSKDVFTHIGEQMVRGGRGVEDEDETVHCLPRDMRAEILNENKVS